MKKEFIHTASVFEKVFIASIYILLVSVVVICFYFAIFNKVNQYNSLLISMGFVAVILVFIFHIRNKHLSQINLSPVFLDNKNIYFFKDIYDLSKIRKIIKTDFYYQSDSNEGSLVLVCPGLSKANRTIPSMFDRIQYDIDSRPVGYIYLPYWTKSELENLIDNILSINNTIKVYEKRNY